MKRSDAWSQGYVTAWKDAIWWLSNRAKEMNDPTAKQVLNSAAFSLGVRRTDSEAITDGPRARKIAGKQ